MKWLLKKLFDPKTESDQYWYYLGPIKKRWFGNLQFHAWAAIFFGLTALWPAVTFAFGRELACCEKADWLFDFFRLNPLKWAELHPGQFVLWAFFVTSSLPLFVWREAAKFEEWITTKGRVPAPRQLEWFEVNARHVESFWKTIGSLFIGVGLLSLAKDKADSSDEVKMKALTSAAELNAASVKTLQTKLDEAVMALNELKSANTQGKGNPVPEPAKPGNAPTPVPPPGLPKE